MERDTECRRCGANWCPEHVCMDLIVARLQAPSVEQQIEAVEEVELVEEAA